MNQTTTTRLVCKAPVFKGSVVLCFLLYLTILIVLPALIIAVIVAVFTGRKGRFKAICALRRYLYMVANCQDGNSDPNIVLYSE